MPDLENIGIIQSLKVPNGWVVETFEPRGGRTVVQLHPDGVSNVHLTFTHIELPLPAETARSFASILYADFHELSISELESLKELLGPLADSSRFSIDRSSSGYLNNRRAITIEGIWIAEKRAARSFYLDADGTGSTFMVVALTAPVEEFDVYEQSAGAMILSISWKTH